MGFSLSPAVIVNEIDLSTIVPAVASTTGAIAGVFNWGPVEDRELISNEQELVERFGEPSDNNAETWFTAANFLAYSNSLWVARAASSTAYNALAVNSTSSTPTPIQIKNYIDYENKTISDTNILYAAKWPGEYGNSLKISVCDSATAYVNTIDLAAVGVTLSLVVGSNTAELAGPDAASTQSVVDELAPGDYLEVGSSSLGYQYLKIKSISAVDATTFKATITFEERYYLSEDVVMNSTVKRYWEYFNFVERVPGTSDYVASRGGEGDEMHIVIVDKNGVFTGTPGQVLEVFEAVSRATDAKKEEGGSNYYKDVLNKESKYVWFVHDRPGAPSMSAASITASTNTRAYTGEFSGGTNGASETAIALGDMIRAYNQFRSAEHVDVSLIMAGKAVHGVRGMDLAKYIIENICEFRKDCVALISPQLSDVVNNPFQEAESIIATRNELPSSSYAMMDSGYKYQYDRYNDVYRWVPLNGDVAGIIAQTDENRDPWWSPAGLNRGHIKNVVKLAYNPDKTDRDFLYKNNVNPVVTFPGEGTVLWGDKTLLAKPSAFDRINVRRLLIVLEKAIATAAKYMLFEFNDDFTRTQFRNMVEPHLRDVQGRRGLYDFKVVCDATNNTPEVIDRNEFVGDIYLKPAKTINTIKLNFVVTRTGVEFNEVLINQ